MSSSELIGSHVYSPQQLSTTGQQHGPRHHGSAVLPQASQLLAKRGQSAAVEPGKADGRQERGIKVSRDDPSEG